MRWWEVLLEEVHCMCCSTLPWPRISCNKVIKAPAIHHLSVGFRPTSDCQSPDFLHMWDISVKWTASMICVCLRYPYKWLLPHPCCLSIISGRCSDCRGFFSVGYPRRMFCRSGELVCDKRPRASVDLQGVLTLVNLYVLLSKNQGDCEM